MNKELIGSSSFTFLSARNLKNSRYSIRQEDNCHWCVVWKDTALTNKMWSINATQLGLSSNDK